MQSYFFLKELFLDIKSELREFEELFAKDGTLSHESSVTIVMASCSCALAIDRVTTCNKGNSGVLYTTGQRDSYRELGRLRLPSLATDANTRTA